MIARLPRSAYLLIAIVAIFLTVPWLFSHEILVPQLIARVAVTLMLVLGLYSASSERNHLREGLGLVAVTAASSLALLLAPGVGWLLPLNLAVGAVFYAYVSAALIDHFHKHEQITADTLCSAVAAYFFLCGAFAPLYLLAEWLDPGAIKGLLHAQPPLPFSFMDAFYFSVSTMTSVGFGDITAVSPLARSMAVLEMIVGMAYPAVLIGRLVGIYASGGVIVRPLALPDEAGMSPSREGRGTGWRP